MNSIKKTVLFLTCSLMASQIVGMEATRDVLVLPAERIYGALAVLRQMHVKSALAKLPQELRALIAQQTPYAGAATTNAEIAFIKKFWLAFPEKKKDDELTKTLLSAMITRRKMDSIGFLLATTLLVPYNEIALESPLSQWISDKSSQLRKVELAEAATNWFARAGGGGGGGLDGGWGNDRVGFYGM